VATRLPLLNVRGCLLLIDAREREREIRRAGKNERGFSCRKGIYKNIRVVCVVYILNIKKREAGEFIEVERTVYIKIRRRKAKRKGKKVPNSISTGSGLMVGHGKD
jgi:hypothetical protein